MIRSRSPSHRILENILTSVMRPYRPLLNGVSFKKEGDGGMSTMNDMRSLVKRSKYRRRSRMVDHEMG